jgi:hypothetical protein
MRIKNVSAKRFFKTLALGSAIAVAAVGLPFAAAAPANAVDPVVTTASVTSNTFAISKVGSSYKIALDLNDAKYSNKSVNVYVTRIVYGQKIVVASRTVKLGTGAVGSTTTTRKIKTGDTIKVTKGSLVVFTRKITSVGLGDVIHPTLSITDNINGLATGPINYTFTFSEAVTGFSADDVTVVGGTKGTLTGAAGGTTYGLTVTPLADSTATITVDVAANAATDAAKNGNIAAAQNVQLANTHNPAVVITDDMSATIHANDQVIFTFTFNQPVTGFDSSDVVITHGVKGAFIAQNQSVYTLVVTAPADSYSGNITVDVAAGAATGVSTLATSLAAVQALQPVNTSAPTVTISDNTPGTAFAGSTGTIPAVLYTFTFSEAVTGFTTGDVIVTGGTKGVFTASTALVYTLSVTPNDNSSTSMTVDIAAGAGTSLATGNPTAVATQSVQPVNTGHVVAVITDNSNTVTPGADITFTFTFPEAVTGFVTGDVTVAGGTKGAFTGSGAVYNLIVTPTGTSTTADVAAGTAISAITGNFTGASVQGVAKLTLTITDDKPAAVLAGQTVKYTFTFNKNVGATFAIGDITVTGGSAGSLTTVTAGLVYELVVTPATSWTTAIALSVATTVNSAGYFLLATTTATSQPVDTIRPTVVITQGTLTGGSVTVTFTFSEAVTGFSTAGVTVGAGTKGAFAGSGSVYTLVITGASTSTTVDVAADAANGVTHLSGNSAPGTYTIQ